MVHTIKLNLKNGYYDIYKGNNFAVESDVNHLVYQEDGVWYVVGDPDGGKTGNSYIMIPFDANIRKFFVHGKDVAIKCDNVKADTVYIDIKDGVGEFCDIKCGKAGIAMGKGEIRAKITELESLNIDCGYGTLNVDLPDDKYDITSNCGMGEVVVDSKKLPRQYARKNNGKTVNIICGMGSVKINTNLR